MRIHANSVRSPSVNGRLRCSGASVACKSGSAPQLRACCRSAAGAALPRPQTRRARLCGAGTRRLSTVTQRQRVARRATRRACTPALREPCRSACSRASQCARRATVRAANGGHGSCSVGGRAGGAGPGTAAAARHKRPSVPESHDREAGGAALPGQPLLRHWVNRVRALPAPRPSPQFARS